MKRIEEKLRDAEDLLKIMETNRDSPELLSYLKGTINGLNIALEALKSEEV